MQGTPTSLGFTSEKKNGHQPEAESENINAML
jgi:hypothetical protein